MRNQSRVLVASATMALAMCSSIAQAAFVDYEFINEINSDGRLTGTFQFDDSTNLFGAVDVQVTFDDGHVAMFGAQNGAIPGSAGGPNAGYFAYDFISGSGGDFSAGTYNELWINETVLQFTTPLDGAYGFLDWSASYTDFVDAGGGVFTRADEESIGRTFDARFDAAPPEVSRTAFSRVAVAAVPEPSTYAMMAIGLFGIAGLRRRQNKA